MSRLLLCLALACTLPATSCRQAQDDASIAPPASPAPADEEPADARYLCEGNSRVDLVRDGRSARVTLADGRVLHLGAIAGSQPRTWSELGVLFTIDGDHAELRQDDGKRGLRCRPADE